MEHTKEIENVKNKLLNAVGKYSDYSRYWARLSDLDEEYDETLELYNYDIWIGQSDGTIRSKASEMLRVTLKLFTDLEENARKELCSVLNEIMRFDKEDQKQIWDEDIFLSSDIFDENELEDMLWDWEEHPYDQEGAMKAFKEFIISCITDQRGGRRPEG